MSTVTDLCQSWQVNEREVQDVRRVDFQVDGLAVDALVASCNSRRLIFNFPLHIPKVGEPPVGNMVELCPLIPESLVGIPVASGKGVLGLILAGDVDQLQNQGPASHNATASGKEVSPNDVFEHRGFSRRL